VKFPRPRASDGPGSAPSDAAATSRISVAGAGSGWSLRGWRGLRRPRPAKTGARTPPRSPESHEGAPPTRPGRPRTPRPPPSASSLSGFRPFWDSNFFRGAKSTNQNNGGGRRRGQRNGHKFAVRSPTWPSFAGTVLGRPAIRVCEGRGKVRSPAKIVAISVAGKSTLTTFSLKRP
jgi:hypothetical protein